MNSLVLEPKELQKLKKRNLDTYEKMARFFPNRYYDCRYENGLNENYAGMNCCVIGNLFSIEKKEIEKQMKNGKNMFLVKAVLIDRITKRKLNITWFNRWDIFKENRFGKGKNYLVYGKLEYDILYHSFSMVNPIVFSDEIEENQIIIPEYKKMTGINYPLLRKAILDTEYFDYEEYLPQDVLQKFHLISARQIPWCIHSPKAPEHITKASERIIFDDLLYFAIGIKNKNKVDEKEFIQIKTIEKTKETISGLPFKLTEDQNNVLNSIYKMMVEKKAINALIQGDVACGKTITTFLCMSMAVENGYQAVLMAPTEVLAKQHYSEMSELAEKMGYKAVFLNGSLTAKQKKEVAEGIKAGEYQLIIGTHSVASDSVEYKNLGMIAIDEEHKFGVKVKECLKAKSSYNVPFLTLSATPIPRTIGELIFGENKKIFEIHSMPDGRQKVETKCYAGEDIPMIVDEEVKAGHQVYVICPQIEKDEEDAPNEDEEKMKRHSVEEIKEKYEKHFAGTGITIGCLTGKQSGKTTDTEILEKFRNNEVNILIATTVIEVGVNNPNASVIVIQDADFYGLSTLHQLRGRVKRGKLKPYCILVSPNGLNNPRLKIMCETEDGFKIAEEDYKIRKSGNILGLEQSGQNKYVELVTAFPKVYSAVKEVAENMMKEGTDKKFVEYMDELEAPAM